jgi:hypothetical protein
MSATEKSPADTVARRVPSVPPPRIARSFTISFKGDWGRANLHRVCGWLGYELMKLSGPHSEFAIWNGRSGLDNVQAVGRGKVDVALSVPVSFMRMAAEGKGPCAGEEFPHMRAIGYVPQNDRMVMAIRRDLGIRSFADLRAKKPRLRIAAGLDDGVSFMGMGARMLMAAHGVSREEFASWGGSYVEFEEPRRCTNAVLAGNADAIIQEAVMNSYWTELADKVDLAFLPIEPAAELSSRHGPRDGVHGFLAFPAADDDRSSRRHRLRSRLEPDRAIRDVAGDVQSPRARPQPDLLSDRSQGGMPHARRAASGRRALLPRRGAPRLMRPAPPGQPHGVPT